MVFVVHIAAGVAGTLVIILKALGITSIAGHPVTVAGLTTLSATSLLTGLASALGVTFAPLGAKAGQKSIAILMNFGAKAITSVSAAAISSPQTVGSVAADCLNKAIREETSKSW